MITEQNFNEVFKVFLKANPNDWRMIRRGSKPINSTAIDLTKPQEMAWLKYLAAKGMRHRLSAWQFQLSRNTAIMVPCADPAMFDLGL